VSELIVLAFADRYQAAEVLNGLRRKSGSWSETLEHSVAVALDPDGKAIVQMNVDLSRREAVAWARVWGALLKAVLFVPLTDGLAQAADKVACPSVQDDCSPEAQGDECSEIKWWQESLEPSKYFRRDVAALIVSDTSAILILAKTMEASAALKELRKHGNMIMHTTISPEQDQKLNGLLKGR